MSEIKQSLEGQILLQGENLTLNSRDIDQELSRIESSQNFNLVDVAAFFVAGPIGLVVTKGYNFGSIFQGSGGRSDIRKLISLWNVEHGVGATAHHRLGKPLCFTMMRYMAVPVAVWQALTSTRYQFCAGVLRMAYLFLNVHFWLPAADIQTL